MIIGGYNELKSGVITKVRKCQNNFHLYHQDNMNQFFDKLLSGKITKTNQEIASVPIGRIYARLYKRKSMQNLQFQQNISISEDT